MSTDESVSYYEEAGYLAREALAGETDMPLRQLAASLVCATLAVADELKRSNEDRDRFYSTMREFFEKVTEDPYEVPEGSSLRSEQPAAAPDGQEVRDGNE